MVSQPWIYSEKEKKMKKAMERVNDYDFFFFFSKNFWEPEFNVDWPGGIIVKLNFTFQQPHIFQIACNK